MPPPPDSPPPGEPNFRPFFLTATAEELANSGPMATAMELEHANFLPDDFPPGLIDIDHRNPLTARHREVARLLFLGTKSQTEIAGIVGFAVGSISKMAKNPRIVAEVERLRERMFEVTVAERLKQMGPAAANVIEGVLSSGSKAKLETQLDAARWVIEKLTGKARQEVDVQSSTLSQFMQMLAEHKAGAPAKPGALEHSNVVPDSATVVELGVSPALKEESKFANWVDTET